MTDQEIRAKALEIAVLIKGDAYGLFSGNGELVISQYLWLAEAAEKHIRGDLKSTPAESA